MRDGFLVDWAFAARDSLEKFVKQAAPEEIHRWPILRGFDAEGYVWHDRYVVLLLRDKLHGIPAIGPPLPIDPDAPTGTPTRLSINPWHTFVRDRYKVGPSDLIIIIPARGDGPNVESDWKQWEPADQELWRIQLVAEANRQLAYLHELDARKGLSAARVPPEISESLAKFRRDHPTPELTGFLMMRLVDTPAHKAITEAVRDTATAHGLTILRADDKEYHPDLQPNVLTYIYGCGFGIAVFERIEQDEFNPNVAFEVGYMLALRKPVCLLKDRTLRQLQTDLLGKLYRQFDPQSPGPTIRESLSRWLADRGLIPK